jgi:hypothetical protein
MKIAAVHKLFYTAAMGAGLVVSPALADDPPDVGTSPHRRACPSKISADLTLMSNMTIGDIAAGNSCNSALLHYEGDYGGRFEALGLFNHRLGEASGVFAGFWGDHVGDKKRDVAVFGYHHELPFRSDITGWVDSKGRPRVEVAGEPRLHRNLSLRWAANTDRERGLMVQYRIKKHMALTAGYDSRFGYGGGLRLSR